MFVEVHRIEVIGSGAHVTQVVAILANVAPRSKYLPDTRPKQRGSRKTPGRSGTHAMTTTGPFGSCPLPRTSSDRILLGHGSGGLLTAELIRAAVPAGVRQRRARRAGGPGDRRSAGSRRSLRRLGSRSPPIPSSSARLFFPGGDIGRLAVHGTVNDLAVGGARPLFLAAAFILEEGLAAGRPADGSSPRCGRRATRRGWRWSPAIPRSSIEARGIRSSSPPPASAWCPKGVRSRSAPPGPATGSSSRARSATTASPSCRCARGSSSRPSWRATPPP